MAVSINQDKIKELLLAKGDKIALGVGGGAAGLLLVWGVVSAFGAPPPSATIKSLTDGAGTVSRGVAGDGEPAAALPGWVEKTADFKRIDPVQFAARGREFEPVFKPNLLRENPQVRDLLAAAQLNVVRFPYKALDIQEQDDGPRKVGVLKDKKPDSKDMNKFRQDMSNVMQQLTQRPPRGGANRPPPGNVY